MFTDEDGEINVSLNQVKFPLQEQKIVGASEPSLVQENNVSRCDPIIAWGVFSKLEKLPLVLRHSKISCDNYIIGYEDSSLESREIEIRCVQTDNRPTEGERHFRHPLQDAFDPDEVIQCVKDKSRLQKENARLLSALKVAEEALNTLASWDEGKEVNSTFDDPITATITRFTLAKIEELKSKL